LPERITVSKSTDHLCLKNKSGSIDQLKSY